MDEKNKAEPTATDSGKGVQSEATNQFEEAREITKDFREATKERLEVVEREEKLAGQRILAGKSEAGSVPEKPKEETPQEYAKRVMANDV